MTDKVQKIKEWIDKEQDGLMDANGNFEYPEHEGAYHILCNLDAYIDSMQEEPKFKTGDRIKPIDSCLGSPRTIVDICDSWYVTDQGTLDFEYEDNWELAEEHKKCMYSKDNYTNEDRKALCDGCEEECEYAQNREPVSKDYRERYKNITRSDAFKSAYENKSLGEVMSVEGEEPVSEELEEACEQLAENARKHKAETSSPFFSQTDYKQGVIDGTKWQKEQFEKNRLAACDIQTEEEAEIERDFVMGIIEKEHRQPTFDDAIKYGMRLQKEKIMANTTDATIGLCYENKYGGYTHLVDVSRPLPVGNNKLAIIFKED